MTESSGWDRITRALVAVVLAAACAPAGGTRDTASPTAATAPGASAAATPAAEQKPPGPLRLELQEYPLPTGQGPHDVAPAADGGVWYTAQLSGELGWLDPKTGQTKAVKLGAGSAPHGVIVGPDGAPWITDGGLNAIVRVDPATSDTRRFPLPADRPRANLNTATFDKDGTLWFTGQSGIYGRLDPRTGTMAVFDAPKGPGPYGITTCPDGNVYYASLAGSYIGRIARDSGAASVLSPPTSGQGARRVWCDSKSRVWFTEWNAGKLGSYDPAAGAWRELPIGAGGAPAQPYAVYVSEGDIVWITDFAQNAIHDFDIASGTLHANPLPSRNGNVRQLLGRPGEVWGAESGASKLIVIRIR